MIDYGNGMIFPDAWAFGPPEPPEPACHCCEDTGHVTYGEHEYPCPECRPIEYDAHEPDMADRWAEANPVPPQFGGPGERL